MIPLHHTALQENLENDLFGQPLVKNVVLAALKGHFETTSSTPLTLSFHGSTGVGKTYVAEFIVRSLYKRGFESKFVRTYVGSMHFPLIKEIEKYENDITETITSMTRACPQSLFIFDEVHKLQTGLLNKISSLIKDSRISKENKLSKAIFIFISNTGAEVISKKTLEYINIGTDRNQFKLSDFETDIKDVAFSEGGLKDSDLIKYSLVDHFVPFLPLEHKHVVKCIEAELHRIKKEFLASQKLIKDVIKEAITFGPEPDNKFSQVGCKRVPQKLNLLIYDAESSDYQYNMKSFSHEDL
ncbi:torsin-like protein isoform X2 [Lycorma delicatula]|uniref:torsin-like protein isoform X2 n=1 Tax=Lycorma delicatula TaxID=130591 RepID=UPI003F517B64